MRKHLKGYTLHLALLSCLALVLGMTGVAFAGHKSVPLYDSDGNLIMANGGQDNVAYSTMETCGSCHHYDKIEQHSYHSQIGANEQVGWASWNPNHSNAYLSGPATKGKSWVQSPGHVGKW